MNQFSESTSVSDIPLKILQMGPEIPDFISQESGCGLCVRHLYVQRWVEGENAPCTSGRPGSCGFDGSEKAAMIRLRFSNAMPLALAFLKEITRASILVLNRSIGTASSCWDCNLVAETFPREEVEETEWRAESWGRVSKSISFSLSPIP